MEMNDVFSARKPISDESGRVVVVDGKRQCVRLRSLVVWAGCHWLQQHVLCGGAGCKACEVGHPRRSYGFAIVDRPTQTAALLRLSATDVARLEESSRGTDPTRELAIGDEFWIRRDGDRKPLTVEFLKNSPQIVELDRDYVMLEIMRLHGIKATPRDIRERIYFDLVRARALEACGGHRVLV